MKIVKSQLRQIIEEELEAEMADTPIPPEELHGALSQAVWDLYKYVNGIRPRFLDFKKMTVQDLESMHHRLSRELEEQTEEDEGWMSDAEDERRDQARALSDAANARLDAAAAEEKEMRTPEEGERLPKRMGMGRGRYSESQIQQIVEAVLDFPGTHGANVPVRRGHAMYKVDDELREIGAGVGNLLEITERVIGQLSIIQTRYGEMAHVGSYASIAQKAAQTLSGKYRTALDELSKSTEKGWYK